jgi:SAM-dependent methyltransferase
MNYSYLAFENAFRGSEENVKEEQMNYLPYFRGATDVLDLGCGRGEFLEHMRDLGVREARGVDLNEEMLDHCRAKGLTVIKEDALAYLRTLESESIDGVFTSHLVEHLSPHTFIELIPEVYRVLKKNAHLVAETLNPGCLFALGPYFMDLTHTFPVHPLTFKFLLEEQGFNALEFHYRQYLPPDYLTLNILPPGTEPLTPLEEAYKATVFKLQTIINAACINFIYALAGKKT